MAPADQPSAPRGTQETGKKRAARIPLDYFRHPDSLVRWKLGLTFVAFIAVAGWLAAGFFLPNNGDIRYSRGPVASVHSTWDQRCSQCHVDFAPMSANHVLTALGSSHSVSDQKCIVCHAGTDHHATQKKESTPSCAGCHRDHQGRDFSLVKLPDNDCVSCHKELNRHCNRTPEYEPNITSFVSNHPEFKVLRDKQVDPGKLKFNHRIHMLPGQSEPGATTPWTLGKIKAAAPGEDVRYREATWQKDKGDSAAVQLDCASCHVLDSADNRLSSKPQTLTNGDLPPRAAGKYYLPTNYELHCKACHPLTFDPNVKDGNKIVSIPHGLQPEEANAFVWSAYANKYAGKPGSKPNPDVPPLPGKQIKDLILENTDTIAKQLYKGSVEKQQRFLYTGKTSCGECHHFENEGGKNKVVPTNVKDIWFEHAKFNHVSHRALDCRSCHGQAYATLPDGKTPNPAASQSEKDVMLPDIKNCRDCHSPTKVEGDKQLGGVRHNCTDCHNYHNGDHALQGLGAKERDPKVLRSLEEWLKRN